MSSTSSFFSNCSSESFVNFISCPSSLHWKKISVPSLRRCLCNHSMQILPCSHNEFWSMILNWWIQVEICYIFLPEWIIDKFCCHLRIFFIYSSHIISDVFTVFFWRFQASVFLANVSGIKCLSKSSNIFPFLHRLLQLVLTYVATQYSISRFHWP